MELRHIRYLLAVADHGNFTRAAESLHVSQPTLSQQVRQLERALGVQLLDRSGRTVRLTEAGEAYAHHARLALRDLDAGERAVHDVQDLSRGHLRVAMTPTITAYLIGPLVHQFHAAHPGVTLTVVETTQDRIEADLLADRIDLGIAFTGTHAAGIDNAELFSENLSLVVGSAHPLAGRSEPLPARELAAHPLALLSRDFATRTHIDGYFDACAIAPSIGVEANSIGALVEFVRRGRLATVLPDAITRDHPELLPIALTPALPTRTVEILRRGTAYHSAASRAFATIAQTLARSS
ncbi:transcriptional regulator CynR [Rhodococcus maanshanensis]|uniref:LysR family transcriptional regulator, cyn operon transcriptional activator n=1 Tax=Rhodococcus maanshanensis TaxID=183556 RepID=A0A1H7UZX3_9NOCA|nr:transcriptional regulator CynR [Rhodococcus maanshanensis]SEM02416.1 LysR family transcriptional regulator, cyn operon transcriptional activator [Rhodococcus maanshanensis]